MAVQGREAESLEEGIALAEALDALRIAITIYDSRERLIFANEHYSHMFGAMPTRGEAEGLSYDQLIRLEVAGGEIASVADVDGYVALRREQLRDGDFRPRDIRLSDGRIVEIKARRTRAGGWILLWTDVTQARHVHSRLESALALSADAFAFFDRDDHLVMCTADFAHLHGFETSEALVGRKALEIAKDAGERGRFQIDGPFADWLEQRRETHQSPAGAMTLVAASGTAYLVRERGTPDGYVTVFTDVTDARRVESALADQTAALERAKRALAHSKNTARRQASYLADLTKKLDRAEAEADTTKNTLLRTMSHELKTPLNAIIGFSDFLSTMAGSAGPDQIREYATLIHQGGTNLLRLLNQILDLTRLAAGRYELQRVAVDAGAALHGARNAYAAEAAAKSIVVDAELCPRGLLVDADETAVNAVLGHLMANAIGFTQEGGQIRLSVEDKGDFVHMIVSDNGPGVAEQDLARILRPFEQAGRSTTDHTAGAGLGLTLVKAFADHHGGSLLIDSATGRGIPGDRGASVFPQALTRASGPRTPFAAGPIEFAENFRRKRSTSRGRKILAPDEARRTTVPVDARSNLTKLLNVSASTARQS